MKFKISQQDFSKALILAGKSLLVKSNLPILSNLLITASKGSVEILSTNLETATKVVVACKVENEGRVTISGKTLLEFVSQLPGGDVTFELLGDEAIVSSEGFKARMVTIAPEEFPAIPKIEGGIKVKLDAHELAMGINRVSFSAAQDEGRPILTGVLCEFAGESLKMIATDGYRLSFDELHVAEPNNLNFKIVIPSRALIEVAKIIGERSDSVGGSKDSSSGEIEILVADNFNQINFKVGEIEYTSRLIEGEFPAWQKVIPTAFTSSAKVNREEFAKLVKIASIFARDGGSIIRLKFEIDAKRKGQGVLIISGNASQVGSSDSQIDIELNGAGGEIAFNFRYLLEILSVFSADEVSFEMVESLNPGRLTCAEAPKFFHIIMPVRLQN